ncbi:MAG: hypothetical protein MRY77_06745 [Rhodobacteraceae bacterium]|nr:hypothetical protein [Paracoccaceae bacterium]
MLLARSYPAAARTGLAALVLTGLAGCAMDKETKVRARLGNWLELGVTTYFKSTNTCTAALFDGRFGPGMSMVQTVQSVQQGMVLLAHDIPVRFDIEGQTPSAVLQAIKRVDTPRGRTLLASEAAGHSCMEADLKQAYARLSQSRNAVLIIDPAENGVVVKDRQNQQVFFMRGAL